MIHLQSFGAAKYYGEAINIAHQNKHWWRKVANLLNAVRRHLHMRGVGVTEELQMRAAEDYIFQAFRDTKIPDNLKAAVRSGLMLEFGLRF